MNNKNMDEKRSLYFQRSNGEHRLLATGITEQEASKEIKKFIDEHKYTSYYTRVWDVDDVRWYDVGSWSEFFKWTNKELK